MQLTQSASMRMEQRQLLTPRMIQSMEILQLPLLALEERIEQELQSNPVLEIREGDGEGDIDAPIPVEPEPQPGAQDRSEDERPLVVKDNSDHADDFDRLTKISEYLENEEFVTNGSSYRQQISYDGERDKKMDAMANTAARGETLSEHLLNQWAFLAAP
jgi:RNA polymerase sigma-54 factor